MDSSKIIFILSLPRSGSTLLQRLIATHDEYYSCAETWFLLYHLYSLKRFGTYAEYGFEVCFNAIEDFSKRLPGGKDQYKEGLGRLYLDHLNSIDDKRIFIDKTPRNALIIDDLISLFPDAKFVILWRNPLSVISSMSNTFDGGRWNAYKYYIDLYDGFDNLISLERKQLDNVYSIKYEDLVKQPRTALSGLFKFLGTDFVEDNVNNLKETKFDGRMGDPTGINKYSGLSALSLKDSDPFYCNCLRKFWIRKYLKWVGEERLNSINYDYDKLLDEIDSVENSFQNLLTDILFMSYGYIDSKIEIGQFRKSTSRYNKLCHPRRHC